MNSSTDIDFNTTMQPILLSAQPALSLTLRLGEGPLWDDHRQRLFFVDINARQLHYYDEQQQQHGYYQFHRMPSALGVLHDRSLLVALEDCLARFVPETNELTTMWEMDIDTEQVRTNDAKVGPDGCYYLGTMDRKKKHPVAALYRIAPDGKFTCLLSHRTISNGITWSSDHRTMYYIDSPTRTVQAYDFDTTSGTIAHSRTLVEVSDREGIPDGMTIDTENHLWVAHNGAGYVARYHGHTGVLLAKVNVPAPHVSDCTFGGADYQTLYITTARDGLSDEQLRQYPQSGSLFAVRPPWSGRATFSFGGYF